MRINTKDYKSNELIILLRQFTDKTQEEFAKEIGISKSSLQTYEYGTTNYPYTVLESIMKTYDLEMIIQEKPKKK